MKLTEEWQKYQHFYHKYQGKTDKCKYLTGEEILTFRQHWMIEQAKVSYSPLEIFNRLIDKMHDGILELSEKINYDDLMDHVLRKF